MKILVSAFAFEPNAGSEGGVGWHWATELAKAHQVTVITDTTRRPAIESTGAPPLPSTIKVLYFRPYWLQRIPLNSTTAQLLYTAWQFCLLPFAQRLHREAHFDLAIHLTYSVFRHPSFLGYLGIPFVFGPVGGGEDAPWSLKRSIRGREGMREILRSAANKAALFDPFLWLAYTRTTLILASTEQTRLALPWPFRSRAIVYPNLGIDTPIDAQPAARHENEPLRILFAGRLVGWKGAHFAILALALARRNGADVVLNIVGSGPYETTLRKISSTVGMHGSIQWHGPLPRAALLTLYRSMHGFIFPSLHDSGGTVILEAQSFGLPVICLDSGGPATLVTRDTALVVPTRGRREVDVVHDLGVALHQLATDEAKRIAMGRAAIAHTGTNMSWNRRVQGALAHVGVSSRPSPH